MSQQEAQIALALMAATAVAWLALHALFNWTSSELFEVIVDTTIAVAYLAVAVCLVVGVGYVAAVAFGVTG